MKHDWKAKYARKAVDMVCPKIVLDLGAGKGWIHNLFSGCTIYAIEPDYNKRKYITQATAICGTFRDFSIPEKADLVLFSSSFHHCTEADINALFFNIESYTTPDARILLVNEFYINWLWILRRIIGVLRMGHTEVFRPLEGNHFRTKRQIKRIFNDYGYDIKFHLQDTNNQGINGIGFRFFYALAERKK